MSRLSPAPDWNAIPRELKDKKQWVRWRREGEDKKKKVPKRPSGPENASADDSSTWGTYEECWQNRNKDGCDSGGIGFVLDGYVGGDLDHCFNEDGIPNDDAYAIMAKFNTYAEVSPSGDGIKFIAKGRIPREFLPPSKDGKEPTGIRVKVKDSNQNYEMYDERRFFAITGRIVPGMPAVVNEANGAIPWFFEKYINPNRSEGQKAAIAAGKSTLPEIDDSERYTSSIDLKRRVKRARGWLEKAAGAISGQGGHNHTLRVAVNVVRGFKIPPSHAFVLLSEWNAKCEPPWNDHDLERKILEAERIGDMAWGEKLTETDESDVPQEWAPSEPQKETVDLKDLWLTPAQAILRAKDKSHRFQTKIPAIDKATSGGIPRGRVLLMAGAPGSGKTTVAIQIACNMAAQGAFVSMLLADEGLDAGVVRMAQRIGFNRSKLESADPETIHAAAKKLGALDGSISCMDPDHEGASLKNFLDGSDQQAAGRPQVWLIDSAQTVFPDGKSDLRIQIKKIADKIKSEGRKRAAVVIFLSQTNRAAYRSKKDEDNSNPLSAAAESGAIEHMADLMVFFTAIDDDHSRGVIPKNRLGSGPSKVPFRLALDRESATYKEVDDTVDETGQMIDSQTKKIKLVKGMAERALKQLKLNMEGLTGRQLRAVVPGRTENLLDALEALRADGKVFSEPIARGGMLWKAVR